MNVFELSKKLTDYGMKYSIEQNKQYAVDWAASNLDVDASILSKVDDWKFKNYGIVLMIHDEGIDIGRSIDNIRSSLKNLNDEQKEIENRELIKKQIEKKAKPVEAFDSISLIEFDREIDNILSGKPYSKISIGDKKSQSIIRERCKQILSDMEIDQEYFNNVRQLKNFVNMTLSEIDKINNTKKIKKKTDTVKNKYALKIKWSTIMEIDYIGKGKPIGSIIGSELALIYDTEKRFINVFVADSKDGFNIKGKTLLNVDMNKSYKMKIRKPEEFFNGFLAKDSKKQIAAIEAIRGKKNLLNSTRLNDKMMVLK